MSHEGKNVLIGLLMVMFLAISCFAYHWFNQYSILSLDYTRYQRTVNFEETLAKQTGLTDDQRYELKQAFDRSIAD